MHNALSGIALDGVQHSSAADLAVQESGLRGLTATDLLPQLGNLLNQDYV